MACVVYFVAASNAILSLSISSRGGKLVLVKVNTNGTAAKPASGKGEKGGLRVQLKAAKTPLSLSFRVDGRRVNDGGCGDDHIVAVNMSRRIERPPRAASSGSGKANFDAAVARAIARGGQPAREVELQHYIGGPCYEERCVCLVVPGYSAPGSQGGANLRGWAVFKDPEQAILAACKGRGRGDRDWVGGSDCAGVAAVAAAAAAASAAAVSDHCPSSQNLSSSSTPSADALAFFCFFGAGCTS